MAIQVRRGNERDFDPNKLLPGEWAVFLDTQKVWMCFAPGIVKRLGTYEDFYAQIAEATKDIRDSYVEDFNEIKADIELIADVVSSNKEEVLIIKSDIINTYLPQIQQYVSDAQMAASTATSKANSASESAVLSKSYAVGGTGTREGENADNAKYYYEQSRQISQGINGIVPMGTVTFANLPTENIVKNAMYNISDAFVSDERFNDGGGVSYGPGNNVIWTAEGFWDVTASSSVTGVKGANETTYRQGNVNITAENVGAVAIGGDTADNIVEFTSSDLSKPTEWTDVAVLASGEKHSSIFNKISIIFKNVRYLYKMLGTTDISSISDGTISGVLAFLKSGLDDVNSNLATKPTLKHGSRNGNTITFKSSCTMSLVFMMNNVAQYGKHSVYLIIRQPSTNEIFPISIVNTDVADGVINSGSYTDGIYTFDVTHSTEYYTYRMLEIA